MYAFGLQFRKTLLGRLENLSLERQPGRNPTALVWVMNFDGASISPSAFSLPSSNWTKRRIIGIIEEPSPLFQTWVR